MTKPDHFKPFPVKLGNVKPFLQQEVQNGEAKSLHGLLRKIINGYKPEEREKFLQELQASYS